MSFSSIELRPVNARIAMALNEMTARIPRAYDELKPMGEEWFGMMYCRCRDYVWGAPTEFYTEPE